MPSVQAISSSGPTSVPKYTSYHAVVFIMTFLSYALFHATRKTFSNVKEVITEEWTPSFHNSSINITKPDSIWNEHHLFKNQKEAEPYLGVLDAIFMISYAVGLYISGMLGDRFNLRHVLSLGMCSSALMVFIFGFVFECTQFYNKYLYAFIWILNGLFQSMGWPCVVAVMGNWFGRSSRGLILGLWSACASVGNIIGAFMVSSVLDYGYEYAFLVTSTALFGGGLLNFFGLLSSPEEVGLPLPDEDGTAKRRDYSVNTHEEDDAQSFDLEMHAPLLEDEVDEESYKETNVQGKPKAVSFCIAVCLPGVALYALAYACLKLVNYSFFFWLPYYLTNKYGWKQKVADDISIWYDVGGIIGGTIFGFISDRFQKRSLIVIPMLLLGIPALSIYNSTLSSTQVSNSVLMSVVGFFIGGVSNLVSAAIAADLGRQGAIQGSSEALATVTGIVDGTGSVGAAIGQILVPVIEDGLGWQSVFYLFMIMTFLTAVCIFPLFVREIKDITLTWKCSWFQGFHKTTLPERLGNTNDLEEEEE